MYNNLIAPTIDNILNTNNINGFEYPGGTDKQTWHSYGPIYESIMLPLKNKTTNILEIGTYTGGSSLLWHELLPLSNIITINNKLELDQDIKQKLNPNRTTLLYLDAYTQTAINQIKQYNQNNFDIIIDDGPHTHTSHELFLQLYLPLLKQNGVAIIEDIKTIDSATSLIKNLANTKYVSTLIDLRNIKQRSDDIMLIIQAT